VRRVEQQDVIAPRYALAPAVDGEADGRLIDRLARRHYQSGNGRGAFKTDLRRHYPDRTVACRPDEAEAVRSNEFSRRRLEGNRDAQWLAQRGLRGGVAQRDGVRRGGSQRDRDHHDGRPQDEETKRRVVGH
jgi:hypothetical protein